MESKIKISEKGRKFIIDEIENYINSRFGSMNKNDFEVLIFNALNQENFNSKTDYEISRALKLPLSKIKRLRYEADLIYVNDNDDEKFQALEKLLINADFTKENDKISFTISDKGMKEFLQYLLYKKGKSIDWSFNKDKIIITDEALISILKSNKSNQKSLDDILRKAKETIDPNLTLEDLYKIAKKTIINGNLNQSSMIGLGVTGISLLVSKYSDKMKKFIN